MISKQKKFYGWQTAIGCGLMILLVTGALNTFSIFLTNMQIDGGYDLAKLALMTMIISLIGLIGNAVFKPVAKVMSVKYVMLLGVVCCGIYYYILGIAGNIYVLWLAAVFGGIASAFCKSTTTSIMINRWFKEKRDAIIGMTIFPMSVGGFIFQYFSGWLNPVIGWQTTCKYIAVILWVIGIPVILFLVKESPAKYGQLPYGSDTLIEDEASVKSSYICPEMKTVKFWVLFVMIFAWSMFQYAFLDMLNYALTVKGYDSVVGSRVVSFGSLIAIAAFLFASWTAGKSSKAVIWISGLASLVCLGGYLMASPSGSQIWLVVIIIGMALNYPSYLMVQPLMVLGVYGSKRYEEVVGMAMVGMYAGFTVADSFCSLLVKACGGTFAIPYTIFAVLEVVSMLVILSMMKEPGKEKVKEPVKETSTEQQ